ncbi:MAG TPA: hypothetical protein VNG33_21570, partial [Polyangiaceae bacterium]|nr:hypothetical protein [Polyangiaceae bacterium]
MKILPQKPLFGLPALLFACSSSPSATSGASGSPSAGASAGTATSAGAGAGADTGAGGTSSAGASGGGATTGGSGTTAGAGTMAGSGGGGTTGSAGEAPMGFGPNVLVFDPTTPMATIQAQIDAAYADQFMGQFSVKRYAFLFKPGAYQLDVKVGYYTQALGLGQKPDDVQVAGAVRSTGINNGNATLSFWRGAENMSVVPMPAGAPNMWAVSQGASFRRMHVQGSLILADTGNSSGGFIADTKAEGSVTSASQQQYFLRNSDWKGWQGGVWNMVFSGDPAAPSGAWPTSPYTVVDKTQVMREKPFLVLAADGSYAVQVPSLQQNTSGSGWAANASAGAATPIAQFYLAHDVDTAATINAALDQGKYLLLTPGIYHLADAIKITRADTVVLGLGVPTLIADAGTPAISIADVSGVKIAGVLVQAGAVESPTLVEVGPAGATASHADNPTSLHDVYCRVGGGAGGVA